MRSEISGLRFALPEMTERRDGNVVICVLLDMAVRLPAAIVISSGGTCGYGDKGIQLY